MTSGLSDLIHDGDRGDATVGEFEKIHVNACVTVKHLVEFLQCNGGKFEDSEGYNCFFIAFVC